jgi:hypothetical protein
MDHHARANAGVRADRARTHGNDDTARLVTSNNRRRR